MQLTDDLLVQAAADVAKEQSNGFPPQESIVRLLAAIAAKRDEGRRHELARQAQERAEAICGVLSQVGLELLRGAIFGVLP